MRTDSNYGQSTNCQGQTHQGIPSHTVPHQPCRGRHQNTTKAKRKALPRNFLQTNHVVIQNLLYRLLLQHLLFFIQARRTGFAALKWQERRLEFIFTANYLSFALFGVYLCVQSWRALAGLGGWEYLKHFAWRRERSQWSLIFGLDVWILLHVNCSTLYIFYFR